MTRVLAIAVVVAQLLDVATWMAMPRAAEVNPLARDLHSSSAWLLKAALVLLVVAVGALARTAPPAKYSVVTSLSRSTAELVAVLAIAAGCVGAGSNLAAITYAARAAEAPRSAPEPALVVRATTGIEQGTAAPAAPERTPAPRRDGGGEAPDIPRGTASWYSAAGMIAAAGPGLRRALGRHWRGQVVRVVAGDRSVVVELSDWCRCPHGRLIDLSDDAFSRLAPLSVGVITVRVSTIVPPATDAEAARP